MNNQETVTEIKHLKWSIRKNKLGNTYQYAVSATGRWDGDDIGNEWDCGFAIHINETMGTFDLYHDDGEGYGDYIGEFRSFISASERAEIVDCLCAHPYNPQ